MTEAKTPAPRTYGIVNVTVSVLVCYLLAGFFSARSLYKWSTRLPVSKTAAELQAATKQHWRLAAKMHLEEPELSLESWFLDAQEAHPLLYPRTYAQEAAKARSHASRSNALASEDAVNDAEAAALARTKGPKVLVLGDSIMMTVGPVIKKTVVGQLGGAAILRAKLATGLARPDVYDWVKELRDTTDARRYDYVIMMLGTNDSQDFAYKGKILAYGTNDWVRVYNRRMDALMTIACSRADHGIWIGLPPMRGDAFNRKTMRINSWAKRQAAHHGCMQYVPLDNVIGDANGGFASYLKVGDHLEKVRMVDGIHVTAQGGGLISAALLDLIRKPAGLAH